MVIRAKYFFVLALVFLSSSGLGRLAPAGAQPQPQQSSILKIHVPAGLLSTPYWLYANGRILSGPHKGFLTDLRGDVALMTIETGLEYWDARGLAVRIENRRITHYREDLYHRIFQEHTFSLAPGYYAVEMLAEMPARGARFPFPFSIARISVNISTNKPSILQFGFLGEYEAVELGMIAAVRPVGGDLAAWLQRLQDDFGDRFKTCQENPVVRVFSDALSTPYSGATIVLDLPDAHGGRREMDVSQTRRIVEVLIGRCAFTLDDDARKIGRTAPGVVAARFEAFEQEVDAYNRRLHAWHGVVTKLDKASIR